MSAQYTPGPWRAYSVMPDQWYVSMAGGIVTTLDRRGDGNAKYRDRSGPDAHLIAAAPELLESLEMMLDGGLEGPTSQSMDMALAAIAKAKGGTK